ncbi:glucosamine-6-phosphate deaminase [soil metagenome]
MSGVRLTVTEAGEDLDAAAASLIAETIEAVSGAAVVVATGRTPMGAYACLASDLPARGASTLRVFQLDEYVGVPSDDPRSLAAWTRRSFVEPLGVDPASVVWLDGLADDLRAACREYDDAVAAAGGLDLAVLGLGPNGHLGFNEPPSDPSSPTREVRLSEASLASNAGYAPELPVPRTALTAGLDVLLGARRVVLVVSGAAKGKIVHRALEGPMTPEVPASFLQHHPDLLVVVDRDAWVA